MASPWLNSRAWNKSGWASLISHAQVECFRAVSSRHPADLDENECHRSSNSWVWNEEEWRPHFNLVFSRMFACVRRSPLIICRMWRLARSVTVTKGREEDSSLILMFSHIKNATLAALWWSEPFTTFICCTPLIPNMPTRWKISTKTGSFGKCGRFPPDVSPFDSGNKSSVLNILKFS